MTAGVDYGSKDFWDFIGGFARSCRLKANKDWTERWFALSLGLTVKEWREAERRALDGERPVIIGDGIPRCPKRSWQAR